MCLKVGLSMAEEKNQMNRAWNRPNMIKAVRRTASSGSYGSTNKDSVSWRFLASFHTFLCARHAVLFHLPDISDGVFAVWRGI